jgi:hypothetical protein
MYSPTNRIYNPKSPIVTHSGYLKDIREHKANIKKPIPLTWKDRFLTSKPTQSQDINRMMLQNEEGSRQTALMRSNPLQLMPQGQLPKVPTGPITDNQGNPLPTNKQIGYTGPPSSTSPAPKQPKYMEYLKDRAKYPSFGNK